MVKFQVSNSEHNVRGTDNFLTIPKPKDVFITDFDSESIKNFKEDFYAAIQTGQDIIPIYIDSPGGDVSAVLGMVDIIKSSPVPVATIALGFCASAGTILLSAGSEGYRFASKHTQLMLHDLSSGVIGKEEEIKMYTKFLDKLQEILYSIYDENTAQLKGTFKKIIKFDVKK
jgi:ATP-dependent Clp protease protease subunit